MIATNPDHIMQVENVDTRIQKDYEFYSINKIL